MIEPVKPHFTTRRSFVAATGFAGVSLYGLWAAYGAAPGPMALLGLDHADGAAHASGDSAGATAMPSMPMAEAGHGGHGAGAVTGPDPGEFSRLSAEFSERFRQSDGRVYPRRIAMMDAPSQDAHAGHDMRGSAMPKPMPMEPPAPAGSQHAGATHTMAAGLAAPAMDDNSPIDVLMTAGKWFYMPSGLLLDAGQRYRFRMMALDVSHGASIQFGRGGRMMRLQPGRITETELRFERPGRYLVFCAVYCGEAHDVMQASIEVVIMAKPPIGLDPFESLPPADRRLLRHMFAVALLALVLGVLAGLATALVRGGLIGVPLSTGYRFLTVHGVSTFFYWLFTAQAALLLGFAATENGGGVAWPRLARLGFWLMVAGLVLSIFGSVSGTPLLYNGAPELALDNPGQLLPFNLGYVAMAVGLMLIPCSAIASLLRPRWQGRQERLTARGFALFTWAGFLIVTGFAALYTFVPGVFWALGIGPFPASHSTRWHIVFHNMHYLPLMATVILWYVLMQALTGVKSVFGERFSKIVFAMYLVFVPPTSLYHMFLEPDLPKVMQVGGSILSLFVSVPTLTAFVIIVASLEVHARAQAGTPRGWSLFGWIRLLPWRHPSMAAMGVAVLSMALGIVFAFVLIQAQLAPLLSDTFFVPGYFHFFTLGTVSMTLLAALAVVLPALGGRPMWRPALMRWMPWLAFAGLLVFGAAGIAAGYMGVPRRVMDVSYQQQAPAIWQVLMGAVAVGGTIMASALLLFAAGIAASLWPAGRFAAPPVHLTVSWGGSTLQPGLKAWVGPVSVAAIVIAMYVFSALGFELMQALPISAAGSASGH